MENSFSPHKTPNAQSISENDNERNESESNPNQNVLVVSFKRQFNTDSHQLDFAFGSRSHT